MTTFTGTAKDGSEVIYVDKKRHLWWLSFVGVAVYILPFWLYFSFGHNPIVTLIPAVYIYFFTAIIDKFMGIDNNNPPEEVVPSMMADKLLSLSCASSHSNFLRHLLCLCLVCRHAKSTVVGSRCSHHRRRFRQWRHARLHS